MFFDKFDLGGNLIPVQDSEAREIVKQLLGTISGSAGSEEQPIFLQNGAFKPCGGVLDVDILGKAQSAVNANHASNADNATEANHATTADSATEANHATTADSATEANHATTADSATEANHATTADSATEANHATTADRAREADSATEANHATTADSATEANHATTADSASNAGYASSSGTANRANHAESATTADTALTANHASSADKATNADYATASGTASRATEANKANSADSANYAKTAEKLGTSDGNSSNPVYFSNGKPVACGSTLDVNISGLAKSYNHPSVINNPFIRITLNNLDGTMYLITGAVNLSVNTNIPYANSFIGEFLINIPENVRCPNGYYSVQLTCTAEAKVLHPSLSPTTDLTKLQGWVESQLNSSTNVILYVTILGF